MNLDEENARKYDIIDLLHNRLKVSWIIEISFNLIATIKRILFFPVLFIRYMILLFPMPTLVWLSVPLIYIISVNYQSSFVDIQQLVIFLTNKISSIYFYDDLSHHLAKSKGNFKRQTFNFNSNFNCNLPRNKMRLQFGDLLRSSEKISSVRDRSLLATS